MAWIVLGICIGHHAKFLDKFICRRFFLNNAADPTFLPAFECRRVIHRGSLLIVAGQK